MSDPTYAKYKYMLASAYFRLYHTEIDHKRVFKTVVNWLVVNGGMMNVVLGVLNFFVGGFIVFSQTYGLIYNMYEKENQRVLKIAKIKPTYWKRF